MGKNAQRRRRARDARVRRALEDSLSVGTITAANRATRRWRPNHAELAARAAETQVRFRKRAGVKPRPRRGTKPWQVAQRQERLARRLVRRVGAA